MNPMELFQCIKTRLDAANQLEYKKAYLGLAKQTPEENLWEYGNHLQADYKTA